MEALLNGGVALALFLLVFYVGSVALIMWIGYRLVRAAVKHGILDADTARSQPLVPGSGATGPTRPPASL